LAGAFWGCGQCRRPFDIFESRGECPHCGAQFEVIRCPACSASRPLAAWAGWRPQSGNGSAEV